MVKAPLGFRHILDRAGAASSDRRLKFVMFAANFGATLSD